ncbi:WD40-repeat-containing domain protein [Lentinula edodes]|uniref:WD40-repeat-containing domain protein n=1 Tax=Lentinula edodes TaxID=5353 RepID=UPI001E8D80C7|nr:WD40-repeat-containing domain protein [Lentinula edodes]KAH7878774.1 WD40-repeat-containing domain protein [Lentinula edodes]
MGVIDLPTGTVNALAFSMDGRYLASASDDKTVRVHDIERGLSKIWEHKGTYPYTAVAWRDDILFVGDEGGGIICSYPTLRWPRRRANEVIHEASSPVAVIEVNESGDHLLICSGADVLLFKKKSSGAWRYTDRLPRPAFGETENFAQPPTLATGVHFLESDNECLIAYYHHGFWKCNIDAWETTRIWGPDEKIGTSAKSPDSTSLVATNIRNGLDWFRNTPQDFKKISTSFEIQERGSNVPLLALFINKGQATIMGTTKGYAVIFDAKHGRRIQTLKHGTDHSWVTALAYVEIEVPTRRRMIATGNGNCAQHTQILLWNEDEGTPAKGTSKLWVLPRLIMMIVTVGRMIFVAMGITFAILLLFPSQWSSDSVSKILGYSDKISSMSYTVTSSPSSASSPSSSFLSSGGHSPPKTKFKEILVNLGELVLGFGIISLLVHMFFYSFENAKFDELSS